MNIFVLFGQTATGKTAKALTLAKQHNGELVNFDSRQIYTKLDIITGKDRPSDTQCKIWLYDIVDPHDTFSSAEYVTQAEKVMEDIVARGKTPILVGGTGYYLRHLLYGVPEMKAKEDWELRKALGTKSVSELQDILKEKDQKVFEDMNRSDSMNPRRLIRRIEILEQGGTLASKKATITLPARIRDLVGRDGQDIKMVFLPFFHPTPHVVREKITGRVEERLKNGALTEVKELLKAGYDKDDPGLNAIGYKQLISYLNGIITLEEAKADWINKEVQYAKRQKTYFQKNFPSVI